ncbi:MAG: pseudouridine synthase [Prevotellaceae bacterium]|nr:pseudouridine synthase [Prevotellaceae bacterium]
MCTLGSEEEGRLHPLPFAEEERPPRFTFPFCYSPHPLCVRAAERLKGEILRHSDWMREIGEGKMLGVLVVEGGYLAAFSGTLCGKGELPFFVPPVFDLHDPFGHFQQEERSVSLINREIERRESELRPSLERLRGELAAMRLQGEREVAAAKERKTNVERTYNERTSQFLNGEIHRAKVKWRQRIAAKEDEIRQKEAQTQPLREERTRRSQELQEWLFGQFVFLNARGESRSLKEVFAGVTPPSGAGECCAPKLLQYAYRHGLRPLCMAEFWMGASPSDEIRREGQFYPACQSKCKPILSWMLQGLEVDENPLTREYDKLVARLRVLYSDEDIAVVEKPAGMLSVPGKDGLPSVQSEVARLFPESSGPLTVHRLDMATGGLMVLALREEAYHNLQEQFLRHSVVKRYVALLEKPMDAGASGVISLPISANPGDRPRQCVSQGHGRRAVTRYVSAGGRTVYLFPKTGRTHQLRLHCAHPDGLNNPIVGDNLYGTPAQGLHLLADFLSFRHPRTGKTLSFWLGQ